MSGTEMVKAVQVESVAAVGGQPADLWAPIAVRKHETTVTLSDEDGTLIKIPGMRVKKVENGRENWYDIIMPSALGYSAMAQSACLMLHKPAVVESDGKMVPNGSCDSKGRYHCRVLAMGYNSLGRPWVSDKTIVYDVEIYNLCDLLAKAKKDEYSKYFQARPFMGRDQNGMLLGSPEAGRWAGRMMDDVTVLWVDCRAPDYMRWAGGGEARIIGRHLGVCTRAGASPPSLSYPYTVGRLASLQQGIGGEARTPLWGGWRKLREEGCESGGTGGKVDKEEHCEERRVRARKMQEGEGRTLLRDGGRTPMSEKTETNERQRTGLMRRLSLSLSLSLSLALSLSLSLSWCVCSSPLFLSLSKHGS